MQSQQKFINKTLGKFINPSTQRIMLALPSDQHETGDHQEHENQPQEIKKQLHIIFKILIFVIIASLTAYAIVSLNQNDNKYKPVKAHINQFFEKAYSNIKSNIPQQYINVDKAKPFLQLPICIILKPSLKPNQKQLIVESINNQKYTNYKILNTKQIQNKFTYRHLKAKIQKSCMQHSILLFVDQILSNMALPALNLNYQKHNMWVSYSQANYDFINENKQAKQKQNPQIIKKQTIVKLVSMYLRVFQLIQTNDFYDIHQEYFQQDLNQNKTQSILMTIVFQLGKYNSMPIYQQLIQAQSNHLYQKQRFISTKIVQNIIKQQIKSTINGKAKEEQQVIQRVPYQTLFTLNQQYPINLNQVLKNKINLDNRTVDFKTSSWKKYEISPQTIKQAMQIQQIQHLSPNHSLYTLDKLRIQQKYKISQYQKNQLPLCVCVFSHNYESNNRYQRAIKSISMQKYKNYRIVFFDDHSTDDTLQNTVSQLKKLKFPQKKVTLIKNLNRKYDTFNILNAAFNYCHQNQIQIVIDGDDQLIGQYVFQFINSQFSNSSLWIMHNLDKNDKLQEGVNVPWSDDYIYTFLGRRRWINFFPPLRSWLVKLITRLPAGQHKTPFSDNFYEGNYDQNLQYGLRQMAGQNHSKYVPQINYLSTCYDDNSHKKSIFGRLYQQFIHFIVSLRSPIKNSYVLEESSQGSLIKQILAKGNNTQYKLVQYKP